MKKHFITGLVILLPLAVTIYIVSFIVNLMTKPFVGFVSELLVEYDIFNSVFLLNRHQLIYYSSQVIILAGILVTTIFIGMLTRWFFINYIIHLGEYLLHQIPIINKLYKTSQEIIRTLFHSNTKSFKQVVLVPFPTPKVLCIALVTKDQPLDQNKTQASDLVSIFVPTTPNPTSGYLLLYKREDIVYLDMKVEDAVKFVFSFGMIFPEKGSRTPSGASIPDSSVLKGYPAPIIEFSLLEKGHHT